MPEIPLNRILEITVVVVVLYLVLSNSYGFSSILNQAGQTYVQSVKALQGR